MDHLFHKIYQVFNSDPDGISFISFEVRDVFGNIINDDELSSKGITLELEYSGDGTSFSNADQSHLADGILTVNLPQDAEGSPELEGTTYIKAKLTDAGNNAIDEKIFQKNTSATYGIKAFLNSRSQFYR